MKTKNNLKNEYFVQNITSIKSINQSCWDLCAGETNPFVSYDFLQSLEESGCVSNETGWMPFHLIVNDSNKTFKFSKLNCDKYLNKKLSLSTIAAISGIKIAILRVSKNIAIKDKKNKIINFL